MDQSMSPNKSPFPSQSEAVPASDLACVVWAPLDLMALRVALWLCSHAQLKTPALGGHERHDGDHPQQQHRGGSRSRISSAT